MNGRRLDVQDRLDSGVSLPSSLFYDVGHWVTLVEQPQLGGEGKKRERERERERERVCV